MQAFFSPLGLGIAIQRATPLILTAAAAVLAFQGGAINMGIEGQFMVGGAVAAVAGAAIPHMPGWIAVPIVLLLCALGGALAGWIPAFFRMVSGVSEVITGMIANLVVPPLLGLVFSLPFLRLARSAASRGGIQPWAQLPSLTTSLRAGLALVHAPIPAFSCRSAWSSCWRSYLSAPASARGSAFGALIFRWPNYRVSTLAAAST